MGSSPFFGTKRNTVLDGVFILGGVWEISLNIGESEELWIAKVLRPRGQSKGDLACFIGVR
jgi:hypothetical protein